MPGPIVVGYDGTDGSRAALDEALRVARELAATVTVVFAYDKVIMGGESRDLDDEVARRAAVVIAEAETIAQDAGVAVSSEFVEGRVADSLVAVGDRLDARFIVVGSYGERPLKGALVGSTPYKLIHLAERPVIVVRVPD